MQKRAINRGISCPPQRCFFFMAKSIVRYSVGRNGKAGVDGTSTSMNKTGNAAGAVRLLVLEGDGIGPEISAATLAVLRAADAKFGLRLAFETAAIGWAAHKAAGTTFPDSVEALAKAADGVLLGPVSHNDYPPRAQGGLNPSGELRKRLDLYANIRPARSREGFPPRCGSAGRSRHRAREHRRLLRRPQHVSRLRRIHADAGSGDRHAQDHARGLDPHRRGRLQARAAAAQKSHRRAQGQCAARLGRALSRMRARGGGSAIPTCITRNASSTPWRRFWSATPASSTSSSPPICTATSCPTRRPRSPAASGSPLRSMPAPSTRWRRPSTARRPTSPARTSPIRPR